MSTKAMQAAQTPTRAAAEGERSPAEPPMPAFTVLVQSLLRDVWALVHDHLLLVALEAQRAGRGITRMVFVGVVAAVFLVTGWLALIASAMFWVIAADASWAQAFLAVECCTPRSRSRSSPGFAALRRRPCSPQRCGSFGPPPRRKEATHDSDRPGPR